ncbi:phospho-N-acetylmuramoyl-pentapeptide-transferase [Candidatus Fermentibacteria bacterium]|nr:phospho-N-acetylmuramoyl-pentapeptide-transferase [Candidatus Fermentibacteria bacterium]
MLNLLYDSFFEPDGPFSFLRLFNYITSRAMFAALTGLAISVLAGQRGILALFRAGLTDRVRDYGVIDVSGKRGTPTMGGVIIVVATAVAALLWCDLSNPYVLLVGGSLVWFSALGLVDDLKKNRHRDSEKGLSRWPKFGLQAVFGIGLGIILYLPATSPLPPELRDVLQLPFVKTPVATLGWGSVLLTALIITFAANAVNFADGLDGLAVVPAFFVAAVYGVFGYVLGNQVYSSYLQFIKMPGAGELAIFCAGMVGASVGFLWYNAYPAEVFMGDAGSLPLGGVLGTLAALLRQEVLFLLAGGVFLAEVLSVVLQDWVGLRILKRRIIYRAPLHHTFQYMGMAETKIAVRFWIVSGLLMVISLVSLKVR